MSTLFLDTLLNPASIAVIGASARPNSPGFLLSRNLLQQGYKGTIFLVNPRYSHVLNTPCHKSIASLPDTPELALILTPTRLLRETLEQCAEKGTRVAIVMTGTEASRELNQYARDLGIRMMGPHSAGFIRPPARLNATFSNNQITEGNLAVVSQSASLGAAMVDWAETSNVGFSALLSTGFEAEVSLADLLDLLAEDTKTRAIIVYADQISDPRSFLSALSATSRIKPVVLMRANQAAATYCDVMTRTGEILSSDDIFQAAMKRTGVVRIRTFENLFAAAKILSSGTRIRGNRIAVISNGKAPALIAIEKLQNRGFLTPSFEFITRQSSLLKKQISHGSRNPLILRDAENLTRDLHASITQVQDTDSFDALLFMYVPDSRNNATAIAETLISAKQTGKPVIACCMGDTSVIEARERLSAAGIPSFSTPEAATAAIDFLHRYRVSQQQLLQLPNPRSRQTRIDTDAASLLVHRELKAGKRVLDPLSARELMAFFDIPVSSTRRAMGPEDALSTARSIGYPVAMKLDSPSIRHKAAVAPAQLDISNDEQLLEAWQLIHSSLKAHRPDAENRGVLIEPMYVPINQRQLAVSLTRDPVFGPVISVGIGGDLSSVIHQRIVQLPPLNKYLIDEILRCRELHHYLGALRHAASVDDSSIRHVLRRLSEMACELPEIFSVHIDPFVVSDDNALAMSVHVVLEKTAAQKRYQHLAIHPYPWEWIRQCKNRSGLPLVLRPIRPDDAAALKNLVQGMSAESRYFRFMHAVNELSPQMVARFTKLDYDRQMAFVATHDTESFNEQPGAQPELLGVSRYTIGNDRRQAEFAISVHENYKGQGIATLLMEVLIEHARTQGLETLYGTVLQTNLAMHALMESLRFKATHSKKDSKLIIFSYPLKDIHEPGN
ncbi:MAG: GNAT family N-acetyltransferase [Granulosicoccus sp.]